MRGKLVAWVLVLGFAGPASAQVETLKIGDRVRVTPASAWNDRRIGTVAAVTEDSLILASTSGNEWRMARSEIGAVDVSAGKSRSIFRDGLIGGGIGAVAGALFGAAAYEPCGSSGCFFGPETKGESAVWGGAAGGVIGLVVGGAIGIFHLRDRWRPVRVNVQPVVNGSGMGMSVGLSRSF